jgi:hypothetical protein
LTTDNPFLDLDVAQPILYVKKNGNFIVSSSVINFEGSSFSTILVLQPGDTARIQYRQYFPTTINVLGGQYTTRITFTQMDYVEGAATTGATGEVGPTGATGETGSTGATGPTGPVVAYIFDGGQASSSYVLGPAFDCGNAS